METEYKDPLLNIPRWDKFDDVVSIVRAAVAKKWQWTKNFRCKYITVRIDMRDGGCIIMDRDGERITPNQLSIGLDDERYLDHTYIQSIKEIPLVSVEHIIKFRAAVIKAIEERDLELEALRAANIKHKKDIVKLNRRLLTLHTTTETHQG